VWPQQLKASIRCLRRSPPISAHSWIAEHANPVQLGLLFRQARRPDEALVCYQRALNLGSQPGRSASIAASSTPTIYARMSRPSANCARRSPAARLCPALLNLANIQEDRGRRDGRWNSTVACWNSIHTAPSLALANMQAPADCDARLIGSSGRARAAGLPIPAGAAWILGRARASGKYEEAFRPMPANATVRAGARAQASVTIGAPRNRWSIG
jgi:hypothetical protein